MRLPELKPYTCAQLTMEAYNFRLLLMFSVGKCFDAVILVPMKLHWGWHISYICHPVSSKLLIASLATSLDLAVTQSAKGVNINILEKCMCRFYPDFYVSCSCLIICMPHFRYG